MSNLKRKLKTLKNLMAALQVNHKQEIVILSGLVLRKKKVM